jgi:hypothetical protein
MEHLAFYPLALLSVTERRPCFSPEEEEEEETPESATDPDPAEEEEGDPDPSESPEDEPDEPEDDTPAGKKFAKMRADKKAMEAKLEAEREARIRAEARAEALAEARGQKQEEPAPEEEIDIHPDDVAAVDKAVRKVTGMSLKQLGDMSKQLADLPARQQKMVNDQIIRDAEASLKAKYKDSVPFDLNKAIKYAQENGLAAAGAPVEALPRILEIAHKEMNEAAFDEWRYEQRKKGKKPAPKINDNGTGKKEVREDNPKDTAGYRKLAKSLVGASEE